MGASDARIIAVVQRIVEDVMFVDIIPHHLLRPIRQRIDLYQLKVLIPLNFLGARARLGLLSSDGCHPGAKSCQLVPQGLDLSNLAALIRIPLPERRAMLPSLLFWRERRIEPFDFDAITL